MPKSPSPHCTANNAPINESLANSQLVRLNYKDSVLGTLQQTLYGLTTDNGKPIYKTLMRCGQYAPKGQGVVYVGKSNKTISKTCVVKCGCPECPKCEYKILRKKVVKLDKALQAFKADGGELAFITITSVPNVDQKKSIQMMQDIKAKLIKKMNNDARGLDIQDRGIGYISIEKTFSNKWSHKDEYGNACKPFSYMNVHLHCLIGVKPENGSLISLIQEFRKITKDVIIGSGGWGLYGNVQQSQSLCPRNVAKKQDRAYGFDVDFIDNTDKMASYLNKAVSLSDQLAREMNKQVGSKGKKVGIGMGLHTYLSRLKSNPMSPLLQSHKRNVRTWFKMIFKKNRNKGFNLDYWVSRFNKIQDGNARKWLDRKGYYSLPTNTAFIKQTALYQEWDEMFVITRLHPVKIEDIDMDEPKVVWKEIVNRKLYRSFNLYGMEATLEHLFRVYHFDGLHKECYDYYTEVNARYSPVKAQRLVSMLNESGLLRGSRVWN